MGAAEKLTISDLKSILVECDKCAFPLTEGYRPCWQGDGGYIGRAKKDGLDFADITQAWHLLLWMTGHDDKDEAAIGRIQCAELLIFLGELAGSNVSHGGLIAGIHAAEEVVKARQDRGKDSWVSAAATALKNTYKEKTGQVYINDVKTGLLQKARALKARG